LTSQTSLARGAALITIATAVSRVTGFVRVVVVAAAMGTTFLANTYQTANTAPNVVFELVAAGVLTSIFVPTFVSYLVKGREEEGWTAANALASAALAALVVLSALVALAAPWIMRLLTIGVTDPQLRAQEIELGATFLRLFAPQIAFYGAGMIMTGALHAHRRFMLPAIAPILNNIVVIGVYLAYAAMRGSRDPSVTGITDGEVFLLGAGTTAGVIAMTVCLAPQLARLGWRFRFNFDLSHPAVRKGARLGVWALGYAGGYQAGLIVVLLLANKVEGGVAAYQWAYTFFYLPHALFAIPIFHVLFTAMAEHVARDESSRFVGRLRDGLGMLAFLLFPLSAFLAVVADGLTRLTLEYGVMTEAGAEQVATVLVAFVVGLPSYSAFLVFTRAFYAFGEVKTPALVNAASVAAASVLGAVFFFWFPDRAAVAGLALGHSAGFALGLLLISRAFKRRWSPVADALGTSLRRTLVISVAALLAMAVASATLPDSSKVALVVNLAGTAITGAVVYLVGMKLARAPELGRLRSLLPGAPG
jgi:putative peptidoglycan lipid II flippase